MTSPTESLLASLDRWRHRIPFWWWLTYDALVGVVIVVGIAPSDPAFWLGFAVLAIAVAIDTAEFLVKRPSARAMLDAVPNDEPPTDDPWKSRCGWLSVDDCSREDCSWPWVCKAADEKLEAMLGKAQA